MTCEELRKDCAQKLIADKGQTEEQALENAASLLRLTGMLNVNPAKYSTYEEVNQALQAQLQKAAYAY